MNTMSDDEGITVTVEVTRGTKTDDRDKIRAKVSALTVDELDEKMAQVQDRLERWADDLRDVQPLPARRSRTIDENQATLEEGEA